MQKESLKELTKDFKNFRKRNPSRHYPKKLRDKAKDLMQNGASTRSVSAATGVHPTTLSKWKGNDSPDKPFSPATVILEPPGKSKITVITGIDINDLANILDILQ